MSPQLRTRSRTTSEPRSSSYLILTRLTSEGWIADYADPYDFINVLLSGDSLHASNNNNVAYFNDPTYNKQMRSAALLSGAKRYTS